MTGILNLLMGTVRSAVVTDPYFEYTTLLLPGNGTNGAQNNTFLDGSTNNFTITRNGNTTQGTFSPFSQTGWGNYFDGSGDYLSYGSNAIFGFGTADFTVEAWVYIAASANFNIFNVGGAAAGSYGLYWAGSTSKFESVRYGDPGGSGITTNTYGIGQWYHIAASRSGGTARLFINGNIDAGATYAMGSVTATAAETGRIWQGSALNNGYISNLRVITGTALYTANFTPPTAPLTAISGTSLLTCQSNRFIDNSTNNFTITPAGNTSVVAFSPFNPTASWSAATNGGSGYFDGNGDYLDPPSNAAFQFGTGDFCLEGWIYPTDTTNRAICGQRTGSSGDNSWVLSCNPTNASSWGYVYFHTDNTAVFGSSVAINTNAWTHVVFTCVSGRYRIFQNGILSGTTLGSYNFNQTTGPRLGSEIRTAAGAAAAFLGWMSGWIITKGGIPSAYSTASTTVGASVFTPPSTPATNSGSLTAGSLSLLLNFTNAGVYDATSKNDLETVGNAQISTSVSKFGGGSIAFDGTGDYLQAPISPNNDVANGNFTIEAWIYPTSTTGGSEKTIVSTYTNGYIFYIRSSDGKLQFDKYGVSTIFTGSTAITANVWTYVAVTRSGNTWYMFINGTQDATATSSTTFSNTSTLRVADSGSGTQTFYGYIDDLRITKGYARYTANFTAPTAAFPTL